jgi:hypothetical protein
MVILHWCVPAVDRCEERFVPMSSPVVVGVAPSGLSVKPKSVMG